MLGFLALKMQCFLILKCQARSADQVGLEPSSTNQCRANAIPDFCDRLKQSEATTSVSTGALEHSQITAVSCGPAVCFWIKVQP